MGQQAAAAPQAKYEFVEGDTIVIAPGRTLKRIRALVTIAALGVTPGTLGGYVEKVENLDAQVSGDAWVYGDAWVSGDAWVYGNAQVYGNARVYGDAWVYGDARVYGDAWVYGDARVYGDAWVYGDARVSGDAWVYGNAQVYGDAWVYGDARVSGDAWVYGDAQVYGDASKTPIFIGGLRWSVTAADTTMVIGCQSHTIGDWWAFGDGAIRSMDSDAEAFWRVHKNLIFGLLVADGRFVIPAQELTA